MTGIGLLATDTTANLKEPLDATFRALGTTPGSEASATVEDADVDRFLAVGDVFVLRRALKRARIFADSAATTLGTSKRLQQIYENLRAELAIAEAAAASHGVTAAVTAMTAGIYRIDDIEPVEVYA